MLDGGLREEALRFVMKRSASSYVELIETFANDEDGLDLRLT